MHNKILVIGQTPPPYHGQALMVARLVRARFERFVVYHIRMKFSESIFSVGKFRIRKIFHIFEILYKAVDLKLKEGIDVLYYLPAGPNLVPILRDIILLGVLRILFSKVVFHFRAAGLSEYIFSNHFIGFLAYRVYNKPDIAIQLSKRNPSDGKFFNAKNIFIVPNGIEDCGKDFILSEKYDSKLNRILYVGLVDEKKGILELIRAANILKEKGHQFIINIVGGFASIKFKKKIGRMIIQLNLEHMVFFRGILIDNEKWRVFKESEIFCLPSYFESFGNVLIEAMMFSMPIIASDCGGIGDIVENKFNGFLVPPRNYHILAEKIELLINNKKLRIQMGNNGRKKYIQSYTLDKHLKLMEQTLSTLF